MSALDRIINDHGGVVGPSGVITCSAVNLVVGGNCRKCLLKSEADIAAEIRDDAADDWPDRMEAATGHTFSKRYSHREMREFLARQGDWVLSTEGFLCQASDGECAA